MTTEEQRIAIAEACGWVRKDESYAYVRAPDGVAHRIVWYNPDGVPQPCGDDALPDYPRDLNACHEMEAVVARQWDTYFAELINIRWRDARLDRNPLNLSPAHATAAQRCEAFLRTIGKWEN